MARPCVVGTDRAICPFTRKSIDATPMSSAAMASKRRLMLPLAMGVPPEGKMSATIGACAPRLSTSNRRFAT